MATLSCVICGSEFEWARRGRQPATCGADECVRKRRSKSVRENRWRARGGVTVQTRVCIRCGSDFEFARTAGMRGQGPGFCSDECRHAHRLVQDQQKTKAHRARLTAEERSRRRRIALLARYAMTPADYERRLLEQRGACAICGATESKHHSLSLQIDHDRSCCARDGSCGKCVRSLLCSNCNRALGLLGDRPDLLRAGAAYIERHRVEVTQRN